MSNPYRGLNGHCFWARAMTAPAPGHIDPVVRARRIEPHHKVATMGSCFAQHLARHIRAAGLNYFVVEQAPESLDAARAQLRNFGVFSARYGNVYTVRQALQLFDRAFGSFTPAETVWHRDDRFVDPFRPQIEPEGFSSPDDVLNAAREHLGHVRDVFTQSDWLVFTLGLTEAWRSRTDGAVYPVAPGVAGGDYTPEKYEFVNFTAGEVREDLSAFVRQIRKVNPAVRILLTVSPVPLIATYEDRHVWVSTCFSKAALRVAADEVERSEPNVWYFPSYEIITSPAAGARYYADDLRQVTNLGVSHVMRVFTRHFIAEAASPPQVEPAPLQTATDVVCDEEMIEAALRRSGFW
jgi:GSCFA family protein